MIANQGPGPAYTRERRLMFVAAVAVVTAITLSSMALAVQVAAQWPHITRVRVASRVVTESSVLTASRGKVVFSDTFRDHRRYDFSTSPFESAGTSYTYTTNGLEIVATGFLIHVASPPYNTQVRQVGMSVSATQTADTPLGAGFGVQCRRGSGADAVRYQMYAAGSIWFVVRRDGLSGSQAFVLKQGTPVAMPGPVSMTIVGVCATLADGLSTRVAMFVNGIAVADLVDTANALPGSGWLTGLIVASLDKAPSKVTATSYEVRNLSA